MHAARRSGGSATRGSGVDTTAATSGVGRDCLKRAEGLAHELQATQRGAEVVPPAAGAMGRLRRLTLAPAVHRVSHLGPP